MSASQALARQWNERERRQKEEDKRWVRFQDGVTEPHALKTALVTLAVEIRTWGWDRDLVTKLDMSSLKFHTDGRQVRAERKLYERNNKLYKITHGAQDSKCWIGVNLGAVVSKVLRSTEEALGSRKNVTKVDRSEWLSWADLRALAKALENEELSPWETEQALMSVRVVPWGVAWEELMASGAERGSEAEGRPEGKVSQNRGASSYAWREGQFGQSR